MPERPRSQCLNLFTDPDRPRSANLRWTLGHWKAVRPFTNCIGAGCQERVTDSAMRCQPCEHPGAPECRTVPAWQALSTRERGIRLFQAVAVRLAGLKAAVLWVPIRQKRWACSLESRRTGLARATVQRACSQVAATARLVRIK
jgi:hypothetical protein